MAVWPKYHVPFASVGHVNCSSLCTEFTAIDDDDDSSTTPLALLIAVVCHTEIECVHSISVGTVFPNTMKSHFSQHGFYFHLTPNVSSVLFSCIW
jgi:hypothetical protein